MKKIAIILLPVLMLCIGCKKKYPKPDHIVIVIEENHSFDQIMGSPHTPFINSLVQDGALFTNSHGVTHPSQPNYIAIFSGSTQGVDDDHCLDKETPYTTTNLGASLINSGYTFTGFAQNMPEEGFTGCSYIKSELTGGQLYARKHCPWVNWQGEGENNFPASVGQPMTEFPTDFSKLPTVSFVIPDQDHDMHNNGGDTIMIRKADDWLRTNLSAYIEWAKTNNSLFILTYDEDNFTKQNAIPTIFTGSMVQSGKYNDSINHYNVLRSIEKMYAIAKSGPAEEGIIAHVWK